MGADVLRGAISLQSVISREAVVEKAHVAE